MTIAIPVLACSTEGWRIENAARSGGQSIVGSEQFVAGPGSRWRAKATFTLMEDADYLAMRGFIAGLDGQSGTFLVGPIDWRGQPWSAYPLGGTLMTPGKLAADPSAPGAPNFVLAANVAANATTLSVTRAAGGLLRIGQYLQIGQRLHIIVGFTTAEVVGPNGEAAPGTIGVTIRPWTRAAYTAGAAVNFRTPQGLMRLADADQGLIELTTSPLSDLALDLVEAF